MAGEATRVIIESLFKDDGSRTDLRALDIADRKERMSERRENLKTAAEVCRSQGVSLWEKTSDGKLKVSEGGQYVLSYLEEGSVVKGTK